jgi:hypothetical protein
MDSIAEIVHLAQTENQDAITNLVRMYYQPALRVAQNILGNTQEGEDAITIAIRDQYITTYVNGALANRVTDRSWYHGKIGLSVWQAKTLYRDIQVRMMSWPSPIW